MKYMEFISFIPNSALFLLFFIVIGIIVGVFLLNRKKDNTTSGDDFNQTQLNQDLNPQNITTKKTSTNDVKYLMLIVAIAIMTVLIPLVAIYLVKNKSVNIASENLNANNQQSAACNAITITDTLGSPLTSAALAKLRPGDEVKILINTSASTSKARFRVNGSEWQEVMARENNNFIANYILSSGVNKFTIEAEIFDETRGWL